MSNIQQFLNDETTIQVLRALVLVMVLVWLLTGGFRFLDGKSGKSRKSGKPGESDKREDDK